MGSKRYMLRNGLAVLLEKEIPQAKRFVDPFCGGGSVVHHVAEKYNIPTLSSDVQQYAIILSGAITLRNKVVDSGSLTDSWVNKSYKELKKNELYIKAQNIESSELELKKIVSKSRNLTKITSSVGPIWNAYGGHYYSPSQALAIDYLLKYLPKKNPEKIVCHAALITAASRCAAAPGHTAQPFQPTLNAGKFLYQSWRRDIFASTEKALHEIAKHHAHIPGETQVMDANEITHRLNVNDLVFLDPPYSGVQYSRFYHVLETIARGQIGEVSGIGRYPNLDERPQSKYSNSGQSAKALEDLMEAIAKTGAKVILTFPKGKCSNGLSGAKVKKICKKYFTVENDDEHVRGYFSTLGGNNKEKNRPHKKESVEMILLLSSRHVSKPVVNKIDNVKNSVHILAKS